MLLFCPRQSWPPRHGAAIRARQVARFAKELGIQTIVVSPSSPGSEIAFRHIQLSLLGVESRPKLGLPKVKNILPTLQRIISEESIDIVWIMFSAYAILAEALPNKVLSIVDVQDILSERWEAMSQIGLQREAVPIAWNEEIDLLRKADKIVTISPLDAKKLESGGIVNQWIPLALSPSKSWKGQRTLAYVLVSRNTALGRLGVQTFLSYARNNRKHRKEILHVFGDISSGMVESPSLRCYGPVESVGSLMRRAQISIDLAPVATGMPIKSLHALANGAIPLVSKAVCRRYPAGFEKLAIVWSLGNMDLPRPFNLTLSRRKWESLVCDYLDTYFSAYHAKFYMKEVLH